MRPIRKNRVILGNGEYAYKKVHQKRVCEIRKVEQQEFQVHINPGRVQRKE